MTRFAILYIFLCHLLLLISITNSIYQFFTPDELKYTFGVTELSKVPKHDTIYPKNIFKKDGRLSGIVIKINDEDKYITLEETEDLIHKEIKHIVRNNHNGAGVLSLNNNFEKCHYQHFSNDMIAAISNCDNEIKGTLIYNDSFYVIHPIPENHHNRVKRSNDGTPLHVIYKRNIPPETDFCGIDNTITTDDLIEDEAGIHEDVFVIGQQLSQESNLVVEIGVFVDQLLWTHFNNKYGSQATSKLQDYTLTMFNNIQIMYKQPTAIPKLNFKIVRFEIFKQQPSALHPNLHQSGNAQLLLDRFCKYQRNLGVRDWDFAILLTGYDIHRGVNSRSISGIARLDGMCDPWNTCAVSEGMDFTSAFISTHELGHSLGMRHDEPYCPSKFIMSSSLGPGKVTWSTCSLRDYHSFLQRLDSRGRNCLRTTNLPERLKIPTDMLPGQLYDANLQCQLMHGPGYHQITPRIDHYDGICFMMWCGQNSFGRIITSHPALEGTFCGPNKWCQLGRCVPYTGVQRQVGALTTPYPIKTTKPFNTVDGDWSSWSTAKCSPCTCPNIIGSIGIVKATRTCTNPAPQNGGEECNGSNVIGLVCNRYCGNNNAISVNQYITDKCGEHKGNKKDPELTGTGSQLTRFPQRACKVFCDVKTAKGTQKNYRFFGDNLPDGTSCGWDKYCLDGECLSLSCDNTALINRDVSCPSQKCISPKISGYQYESKNIGGIWSAWGAWNSCSATCNGGVKQRARSCSVPGKCEGSAQELTSCNTHECPVIRRTEPNWTTWESWNSCSASCNKGSQARYRRCMSPQNVVSYSCQGESMEIRTCEEIQCPRNRPTKNNVGVWASWQSWGTCGSNGMQFRYRLCMAEPCDGSGQERMSCIQNNRNDYKWSLWSSWGYCSNNNYKQGTKSRTRHCQKGNCIGDIRETKPCYEDKTSKQNQATWGGELNEKNNNDSFNNNNNNDNNNKISNSIVEGNNEMAPNTTNNGVKDSFESEKIDNSVKQNDDTNNIDKKVVVKSSVPNDTQSINTILTSTTIKPFFSLVNPTIYTTLSPTTTTTIQTTTSPTTTITTTTTTTTTTTSPIIKTTTRIFTTTEGRQSSVSITESTTTLTTTIIPSTLLPSSITTTKNIVSSSKSSILRYHVSIPRNYIPSSFNIPINPNNINVIIPRRLSTAIRWGYFSQCTIDDSSGCGYGVQKRVRKCYGKGNCRGKEYESKTCYVKC
ncbi:Stall [Strongyloides ratti]|uniref:Stall n=1 Tax=Strongyloides ratti TaxID=34506 RepID=A0A090LKM0_STRRB|nr:Stall [Strongyloides ratti]CEF70374.1 Stall [Strongyloides ratti]